VCADGGVGVVYGGFRAASVSDRLSPMTEKSLMNQCLSYFITFSCYGTRLHGAEEGSVNRENNRHGTPLLPSNKAYLVDSYRKQNEASYEMNDSHRNAVLTAILEVCKFRTWELFAAHVRSNHVHAVVHALEKPERVLRDFKAYATRRLRKFAENAKREHFWSRHGSTRYLWKVKDVELAIHYVVHEQGEVMALFKTSDDGAAMGRVFDRVSGNS